MRAPGRFMRAGASSRTAYGIGMRGSAIAAVVVEITIARGSWRASAVSERAPRRVHLDEVVERIAAPQPRRRARS